MFRRTTIATVLTALTSLALLLGLAPPAVALPDWRIGPARWDSPREPLGIPLVADLRWATHDGFDRAVVVLRGRRPDLLTLRPDRLTYDPSGLPVPLRGRHKLYLVLRSAATYTPEGENVYAGARLVRPGSPALRGIALVGSWEAVTTFGFTARTKPYRVFTLTDPSRVVVDFRHPR